MKSYFKRITAMMLTFALVFTIPFAFTQEASAASKKKVKVYQPVQVTTSYSNGTVEITNYIYNENGFCSEISDNHTKVKTLYTYNKAGLVTASMQYNDRGTLLNQCKNTIKKGKIVREEKFTVSGGKATPWITTTYKYKKGKKSKETVVSTSSQTVSTFKANGNLKKKVITYNGRNNVYTYDKKGNLKSVGSNAPNSTKTKFKNKYKNGKLVKTTETYVTPDGKTYQGYIYTYSYKKGKLAKAVKAHNWTENGINNTDTTITEYEFNKAGLLTKVVTTHIEKNKSTDTKYTNVMTIKYKKIAVDKKAKKNIKEEVKEFSDSYLPYKNH